MSAEIKSSVQGYEAYLEHVNITLFNDVIAFVMATSAADVSPVRRRLDYQHLWYSQSHSDNIQEQYGFRYFGELLERFEDKAGSDVKDIRAIALAMAYTDELLTDDMFVGSQRASFMRRITRLSDGDIYLKGAIYLMNRYEPGAEVSFGELVQAPFTRTEEIIFVASLFGDICQAIEALKPRLVSLLGTARTMSVFGNINVYAWLIRGIYQYHQDKGIRSKDMAILRALIELPVSFVKAGSRQHAVLLDNGYSAEEVVYLNSAILDLNPVPKTLDRRSIVSEKIAVEFCQTFINSEHTHHTEAYDHLAQCLIFHSEFYIKIGGHKGIFSAIKNTIKIVNPQTFIRMFKLVSEAKRGIFQFDILDGKWDVLSREFDADTYCQLFEDQLMDRGGSLDSTKLADWIQKYDELTGLSYLSEFEREYDGYRKECIFSLFVNTGIIDLKTAFNRCQSLDSITSDDSDSKRPPILLYLRDYCKGATTRLAFDFICYLFQSQDINDIYRWIADGSNSYRRGDASWFFVSPFYDGSTSRSYSREKEPRFSVHRSFLSMDEHKQLFGWLDDYMFQNKADHYIEFSVHMLLDPFVTTLFSQTELRCIFDMVCGLNCPVVKENINQLKQKYLSEAEMQAERDAENAQAILREQAAVERCWQALRDELTEKFDSTFQSLLAFLGKHKYSFQDADKAIIVAAEYLKPLLESKNYRMSAAETTGFFRFGGLLLKGGAVSFGDLKDYVSKMEEDPENAEDSGTAELDLDDE